MIPRQRPYPYKPIEPPLQTKRRSMAEICGDTPVFPPMRCAGVWSGIPRPGERYGAAGWQFCSRPYNHDGPHRISFYDGQECDWVDTRTFT